MGYFDDQIKLKKAKDDEAFDDAILSLAGSVMGRRVLDALKDSRQITKDALDEIMKFYHIKTRELPENISDPEEQMEYLFNPYGIMRRTVRLENGWTSDAIGAFLATKKDDGSLVALIPDKLKGYRYYDRASGRNVNITRKNENMFDTEAICFYKPFPLTELSLRSLFIYLIESLSASDLFLYISALLIVTLLGMFTPALNKIIFSDIITSGTVVTVVAMTVFMLCVSFSTLLFSVIKQLFMTRITTKMNLSVESATMIRILSLPADFFKKYSSGELVSHTQNVNMLCEMIVSTFFSTGLTSVFSLVYISQIFIYAPALTIPALITTLLTAGFNIFTTLSLSKINKRKMELSAKENGMSYALISGIQKIRLAGAEKRAFSIWAKLYAKEAELNYNPPMFIKINSVISLIISLAGAFVLQYLAVASGVGVADYYAFNSAYGMISGTFMMLSSIVMTAANIKPIIETAKPILEAEPEVSEGKHIVSKISGSIELNNVSFRYNDNMPWVLDNLTLKIKSGQYIAIVGKTGCGKTTLMRLLLGFEKPQKGAVYFDGKDLSTIDLKSLRRNAMGVVMQDGKLFQGDIYSNIAIAAPDLTMEEAWEAAEMAGMADDIKNMPMGMSTLISEGSGGISGGQRQRLLIARAIAPKPKILLFDEATSALDNITQKIVSDSLEKLKCTRIVIAHRLSTIKHCDRIIVIDGGKIIGDGNYETLLKENEFFAELIKRQQIEDI